LFSPNRCNPIKSKMDWAAISPSSDMEVLELGCFIGDKYHLSDDAQEKLENICRKLCDPESSKKIRQMIMFRNSMDTDIIPVINAHVEDNLYIYEAMINVLSELTILIEDHVDVVNSTTDSNQYHYELSFTGQNNTPCSLYSKRGFVIQYK
ncbi:COG5, partial [Lepeophtheirus salmonis]